MLILAVDTTTTSGSLAVLRDGQALGVVAASAGEPYSTRLFRHLDFLLRELALRISDFDLFAVATGPGSFTGLRVGLTAVKGWAEVYAKPVAGMSGLEAVAAQGAARDALLVPILDARRGQVFAGLYRWRDGRLALQGEERVQALDAFLVELRGQVSPHETLFLTSTPELLDSALALSAFSGATVARISGVLAPWVGQLGYERAQRGELTDSLALDANYVRRSDAELHWKPE
jgi:tRNA threonylcarbamoyladenosine biosynthesis protein TsaB